MKFEIGGIYHVYNQGNNRQLIFFSNDNYHYFMRKIRTHILPYADVLAWCLMPNHFHLMIEVKQLFPDTEIEEVREREEGTYPSSRAAKPKEICLNTSIGIMLRSYTRGVNKQQNRTGSLFRHECKAICLNQPKPQTPDWYLEAGITMFVTDIPDFRYMNVCFHYIHNNPVKAGIAMDPGFWNYSSFTEIREKSDDSIVNIQRVRELGLAV